GRGRPAARCPRSGRSRDGRGGRPPTPRSCSDPVAPGSAARYRVGKTAWLCRIRGTLPMEPWCGLDGDRRRFVGRGSDRAVVECEPCLAGLEAETRRAGIQRPERDAQPEWAAVLPRDPRGGEARGASPVRLGPDLRRGEEPE